MKTFEFISKAQQKHQNPDGTPKYLYDKSNFIRSDKKLIITCPIHGDFEQIPANHLRGYGCRECSDIAKSKGNKNFILESQQKHQNPDGTPKYLYDKVVYIDSYKTPVIITCPIHGDFSITPSRHLREIYGGCNFCFNENKRDSKREFITKAQQKHQNPDGTPKYLYDKVVYTLSENPVIITCPIHGDFKQIAGNHINGKGCKKCSTHGFNNKIELEIYDYLKSIYNGRIIKNDRTIINPKEIDFYLPDLKLAIELDGLEWHSDKYKPNDYHLQKTIDCEIKGIQLIHIFEDEWLYHEKFKKYLSDLIKFGYIEFDNFTLNEEEIFVDRRFVSNIKDNYFTLHGYEFKEYTCIDFYYIFWNKSKCLSMRDNSKLDLPKIYDCGTIKYVKKC